jgi:leucyl-tRNA synthetase
VIVGLDDRPHIKPMALPDSDLTTANQRVVEARERLERQRELVQKLRDKGRDTSEAEALLQIMQGTVDNLEEDRRQIEDEVAGVKSDQG